MFGKDEWTFTKEYSQKEYMEARRLMGLKSTDLETLHTFVAYGYLHCPEEHNEVWMYLINELERRMFYMKTGVIT